MGIMKRTERRRTKRESVETARKAAEKRGQLLLGAVATLRAAVLIFATGPNWAITPKRYGYDWFTIRKHPRMVTWVGEGNPQELADKALKEVFGKEYSKIQKAAEDK